MHPPAPQPPSRLLLAAGLAISLCAVIVGFVILARYEARPGPTGRPPTQCPEAAAARLDSSRPTLFLFAHPQCPCTRATMSELDRIAAHCTGRVRILVYFLSAPELGEEALHGSLWATASRIPDVEVRADDGGRLARSFGVETSGHLLRYAPEGRLLFEGGITGARGHEGDNVGKTSILAAILGGTPARVSTPVFGCALRSEPTASEASLAP